MVRHYNKRHSQYIHQSPQWDIRQHWLPPNQTEVVPTKKGITLRSGEYAKLKDVASVISDFVPELNSVSMRISSFHSVAWTNLLFPISMLQRAFFISIDLWINPE
jgi:hypothetical protein